MQKSQTDMKSPHYPHFKYHMANLSCPKNRRIPCGIAGTFPASSMVLEDWPNDRFWPNLWPSTGPKMGLKVLLRLLRAITVYYLGKLICFHWNLRPPVDEFLKYIHHEAIASCIPRASAAQHWAPWLEMCSRFLLITSQRWKNWLKMGGFHTWGYSKMVGL